MLQNSGTVVLLIAVTGEASAVVSITATLPTLLVQCKFSRDFEREGDDFAFDYLQQRNIPAESLTALLVRMEKKPDASGGALSYLSNHPATRERAERARCALI